MPLRQYTDTIPNLTFINGDTAYAPGVLVGNAEWDKFNLKYAPGMVIEVEYEENCNVYPRSVTVLWPLMPREDFSSVAFPTMRKVTSYQSIANDLVTIQPMSVPSGLVFYMDHQYGSGSQTPANRHERRKASKQGDTYP